MKFDKELIKGGTTMLILNLLSTGDMYGYQMVRELEKRSDNIFTLKEGTMYPILHSLESRGMVEAYWEDSTSGRKRKYYHITSKGVDTLKMCNEKIDKVEKKILVLNNEGETHEFEQ